MTWSNRRLLRAATLIGLGLGVQVATLWWSGPIAFLAFAGLGCVLTGLGVLDFLLIGRRRAV